MTQYKSNKASMGEKELGILTFRRKDDAGHFVYKFKVSDYHAAKILEYIAQVPHEAMKVRAPYKKSAHPSKSNSGEVKS